MSFTPEYPSLGKKTDEPSTPLDVAHANVARLLYEMRGTLDALIAIRVREFGTLLDDEEEELFKINQSLQFLRTDIYETRKKKVAQMKAKEIQDNIVSILR